MKTTALLSIIALITTGCASSPHRAYTGTWCANSSKGQNALLVTDDGKFILLTGKGTITKQEYRDDNSYTITINSIKEPSKEEAIINLKLIKDDQLLSTTLKDSERDSPKPELLFKKAAP